MSTVTEKILQVMADQKYMTCNEIATACGVSTKSSNTYEMLRKLCKDGVVHRVSGGPGIAVRYILVANMDEPEDQPPPLSASTTNPFEWRTYQRWEPEKKIAKEYAV